MTRSGIGLGDRLAATATGRLALPSGASPAIQLARLPWRSVSAIAPVARGHCLDPTTTQGPGLRGHHQSLLHARPDAA